MDIHSQIVAKRLAADWIRESAGRMSGDYRIQELVFAAELDIQADILEHQLLDPAPELKSDGNAPRSAWLNGTLKNPRTVRAPSSRPDFQGCG